MLFLATPVRGQQAVTFNTMQIALWPEYDRPSVLVIYRIVLASDVSLPTRLSLRIPASAGEPNAIAQKDMLSGGLVNVNYTRQLSGAWATIDFTVSTAEVQIEYYDTGIQRENTNRHYEYLWPGDYAIQALSIQVQQPLGATNLRISPTLGPGTPGQDGLTYYLADIGAVPAGQTVEISLDYDKASDDLSVAGPDVSVQPSAPIPENVPVEWTKYLPWVLGILGMALLVGGILWYWQSGKQKPAPKKVHRGPRAAAAHKAAAAPPRVARCIVTNAATAPRLATTSAAPAAIACGLNKTRVLR
jgi:hypothetical protein